MHIIDSRDVIYNLIYLKISTNWKMSYVVLEWYVKSPISLVGTQNVYFFPLKGDLYFVTEYLTYPNKHQFVKFDL